MPAKHGIKYGKANSDIIQCFTVYMRDLYARQDSTKVDLPLGSSYTGGLTQ